MSNLATITQPSVILWKIYRRKSGKSGSQIWSLVIKKAAEDTLADALVALEIKKAVEDTLADALVALENDNEKKGILQVSNG